MAAQVALVALETAHETLAVVERLRADGHRVAVLGDPVAGAELALPRGDDAAAVERVERELGSLDVLVVAAPTPAPGRFVDADPAEWLATVHGAMSTPFRLVRAAVPALRRAGDSRILLVGAGWGAAATPHGTAAAAVHGAMVAFMKTLARDLGPDGIIVNEIAVPPQAAPDGVPDARALAAAVGYLSGRLGAAVVGQVLTTGRGGELRP